MPLKVTFELSDADLRHFRGVMRDVRHKAKATPEETILQGAAELADDLKKRAKELPDFVVERLSSLETMLAMLEDAEWRLEGKDRARVVEALAYFAEPTDLIPDTIPGLGYLDDAIMVQLVVEELKHEFDAYEDFCRFRDERRRAAHGRQREADVEALEHKRVALQQRMRRRRDRRRREARTRPRGRSPFALW